MRKFLHEVTDWCIDNPRALGSILSAIGMVAWLSYSAWDKIVTKVEAQDSKLAFLQTSHEKLLTALDDTKKVIITRADFADFEKRDKDWKDKSESRDENQSRLFLDMTRALERLRGAVLKERAENLNGSPRLPPAAASLPPHTEQDRGAGG